MIHHVSVGSNDIDKARKFYDPVMALLGFRPTLTTEKSLNYGVGETMFSVETPVNGKPASAGNGVHIAFVAQDRAMVQNSMKPPSPMAGRATARPACAPNMTPIIMARSYSTLTATRSKR